MSEKFTIRVDHHVCVGNGMCIAIAPKVFVSDSNGQSVVVDSVGEILEAVSAAVASCPVSAILVEDAETHEVIEF